MTERFIQEIKRRFSMTNIVMVADPGGTTGLTIFDKGKLVSAYSLSEEEVYQFCAMREWKCELIIEQFLLYPWTSQRLAFSELTAPRVIGAFMVYAVRTESEIIFQNASDAKNAITNELIRQVIEPFPSKSDLNVHVWDSMRHAVLYASRKLSKIDRG